MMDTSTFRTVKLPPAIAQGAYIEHPKVLPLGWSERMLNRWNTLPNEQRRESRGRHTHNPFKS